MNDIEIVEPLEISLKLIESDDRLPSIKFSAKVLIKYSNETFIYQNDGIWFECLHWDTFLKDLNGSSATLLDMSEEFRISISYNNELDTYELACMFSKKHIKNKIFTNFESDMSFEHLTSFKKSFSEFPKWW